MGTNSKIEYVNHSLNFWIGCTRVSVGCENCYAHSGMKMYGKDPTVVTRTSRAIWRQPLIKERATGEYKWKSGDKIFVCSWSDFFHKDADGWRTEAWDLMRKRPDLYWVIVTKRLEQVAHWIPVNWDWPNRVLIVTCENQEKIDERIPQLLKLRELFPNLTLGVSLEPLLGEVDLPFGYSGIDWAIIGCESGLKRRPCKIEWVTRLMGQLKFSNIPVFVKQLSINGKVSKDMAEWPESIRYRQLPF